MGESSANGKIKHLFAKSDKSAINLNSSLHTYCSSSGCIKYSVMWSEFLPKQNKSFKACYRYQILHTDIYRRSF